MNLVNSHGGLVRAIDITLLTLLSEYSIAHLVRIEETEVLLWTLAYLLRLESLRGLINFLHDSHSINFTSNFIWLAKGLIVPIVSSIAGSHMQDLTISQIASAT